MRESPSADDLDGRTALLLLTQYSAASRVLFMLPNREGAVGVSADRETGFCALRFEPDALPFSAGTFDSVVVDIDATVRRHVLRAAAVREVHRVLRAGGTCVIAASSRRVPREWRNWRQYHLAAPDRLWFTLLSSDGGFAVSNAMLARLDRTRLVEVQASSHGRSPDLAGNDDRRIMVLCRTGEAGSPSFLEKLVGQLQASTGRPFHLERFLIRRIGKTTLIVASDDGRRYVVRVARTRIAADRGRRNFAALKALQSTNLIPDEMKAMIPRPETAGTIDRYPYYVEESLPGTARDGYGGWVSGSGWEPGALRFISDLHFATERRVRIDRAFLDRFVAAPLEDIRRRCSTSETDVLIEGLRAKLECALMNETLPLVWSHGDLSAGNCLYDDTRQLSAVVDWELFSEHHLPLLDILNVMEIPGERNSLPTWQRFDTIRGMFRDGRMSEMPALTSYVERIDIPQRVIPALGVMYWVDHVAKRIDARAGDAVWMRKRVLQPLSSLASIELT